jgi:hypothetical protein
MVVCWISAGVSSFIAGYLERDKVDKFIYIHIEEQHEDSIRFITDCEKALDKEIEILQSPYQSVENVINKRRFINSRYGAACTEVLKKEVRKKWEWERRQLGVKDFTYVWGIDVEEAHRAETIIEANPGANHLFPMIEKGLTKSDAHGISRKLGLRRPAMYDLGYRNNNCRGCVKGGMGYWNKIRVDFPDIFETRARQEREIGHTCITEVKGGKKVPVYLDELDPGRGRFEEEIMEECGIYCMIHS